MSATLTWQTQFHGQSSEERTMVVHPVHLYRKELHRLIPEGVAIQRKKNIYFG
jgi:hypothetical protein